MKKKNKKNRQSSCYLKPKEEKISSVRCLKDSYELRTKETLLDLAFRSFLLTFV